MKKIAIVLLLLVGAASFAQNGEKSQKDKLKNMTPEQVATLRTKKATLALDLSEQQQEQMKAFLLEKAEMRKSKMAARKARKDDQGEAVTADERFARASERLDYQIAQKKQLQKILSAEQMAKWEDLQKRKGHRSKGKKHHKSRK